MLALLAAGGGGGGGFLGAGSRFARPGHQTSVLRDDRAAEPVVDPGGDQVDVLTDAVGARERADRGAVRRSP